MICAGCGLELPPSPGRPGRPARFHNGACRQRARRARLTRQADAALTALDAIQTRVSEMRRAILEGQTPAPESVMGLTRAADNLAQSMTHPGSPEPAVTEHVTIFAAPDEPEPGQPQGGARDARVRRSTHDQITEDLTAARQGQARPRRRRRPPRPRPLDLDTVRLERSDNPGTWRVLAGDTTQPTLVGFLEPAYRGAGSKRWTARTAPGWTPVPGGPWTTRKDALLRLLDNHQRAAKA